MMDKRVQQHQTDILIVGSGGAGLFAALHAHKAAPELDITVAVKGLLGKSGCTRMVQGGYNVAIGAGDSIERHFMDTIKGGKWLNNQDLAWSLISTAITRVHELENELGCFFDRNADGSVHLKAFAGQTYDRTVHKGDLTGIEIINRLAEQVWARRVNRLEEHRAVALIPAADGSRISGVLFINIRDGSLHFVQAKAVLLASGGGPSMYRYHTPSGDKTCDGMAMALRAGLTLRDMEMVQFHPTGLVADRETRITGTIIEEGLRGAGGYLLNGELNRFMENYDERGERATRDIVSRAMFEEMRQGRTGPNDGLYITMQHLDHDLVRRQFKGMVERCADCGFDLVEGLVEVVPTAHYIMGGIVFDTECNTAMPGLFAAGEDTGGVHGANRLGGNGVANSTVFGGIAGDTMPPWVKSFGEFVEADTTVIDQTIERLMSPFGKKAGDLKEMRERLEDIMWDDVGIIRDPERLTRARSSLNDLESELLSHGVATDDRAFNLTWHDWLNLDSLIVVSRAITEAAMARENSRGAHYREDFPEEGDLFSSYYTTTELIDNDIKVGRKPVKFSLVAPGDTLIVEEIESAVA